MIKYSPYIPFSPVAGSRVNATPVPDVSPMLPNTIACTFTAVPQFPGISFILLYTIALGLSQLLNTALTAPINCSVGSCGNSSPFMFSLYTALNLFTNSFKSSVVNSVS